MRKLHYGEKEYGSDFDRCWEDTYLLDEEGNYVGIERRYFEEPVYFDITGANELDTDAFEIE